MSIDPELQSLLKAHGLSPGDKTWDEVLENLSQDQINAIVVARRNDLARNTSLAVRGTDKPEQYTETYRRPEAHLVSSLDVLDRTMHFDHVYLDSPDDDVLEDITVEDNDYDGPTYNNPDSIQFADDWISETIRVGAFTTPTQASRYALMYSVSAWGQLVLFMLKTFENFEYIPSEDTNTMFLDWPQYMRDIDRDTKHLISHLSELKRTRLTDIVSSETQLTSQVHRVSNWLITRGLLELRGEERIEAVHALSEAFLGYLLRYSPTNTQHAAFSVWREILRVWLHDISSNEKAPKSFKAFSQNIDHKRTEDRVQFQRILHNQIEDSTWTRIRRSCEDFEKLSTFQPDVFLKTFDLNDHITGLLTLKKN